MDDSALSSLHCFGAVGSVTGRPSGLYKPGSWHLASGLYKPVPATHRGSRVEEVGEGKADRHSGACVCVRASYNRRCCRAQQAAEASTAEVEERRPTDGGPAAAETRRVLGHGARF